MQMLTSSLNRQTLFDHVNIQSILHSPIISAEFLLTEKKSLITEFLEVVLNDMGMLSTLDDTEFRALTRIMGAWLGKYTTACDMT